LRDTEILELKWADRIDTLYPDMAGIWPIRLRLRLRPDRSLLQTWISLEA